MTWKTWHKCAFCTRRYKVKANYDSHLTRRHGGDPRKLHKVDVENEVREQLALAK